MSLFKSVVSMHDFIVHVSSFSFKSFRSEKDSGKTFIEANMFVSKGFTSGHVTILLLITRVSYIGCFGMSSLHDPSKYEKL